MVGLNANDNTKDDSNDRGRLLLPDSIAPAFHYSTTPALRRHQNLIPNPR